MTEVVVHVAAVGRHSGDRSGHTRNTAVFGEKS